MTNENGELHTLKRTSKGGVSEYAISTFSDYSLERKVGLARRNVLNEPHLLSALYYVRTADQVREMVTTLAQLPKDRPWMSFDIEAFELGHTSWPALIQICDHQKSVIYLVDSFVLQHETWDTATSDGTTLKSILEDPERKKLIYDCRQDSCCLFGDEVAEYGKIGIKLRGIIDVQILHLLLMNEAPDLRKALPFSVEDMAGLPDKQLTEWKTNKTSLKGHNWEIRPLTEMQKKYAAGDVELLYRMYLHAERNLTEWGMSCAEIYSQLEVQSTWTTQEKWEKIQEKLIPPSAIRDAIRLDFKKIWDDTKRPILKDTAPTVYAATFFADTGVDALGDPAIVDEPAEEPPKEPKPSKTTRLKALVRSKYQDVLRKWPQPDLTEPEWHQPADKKL